MTTHSYQPGKLVALRGREWIVLPSDDSDLLVVKPMPWPALLSEWTLATLGAQHSNAIFFAGDLGQRIFQQPFSW